MISGVLPRITYFRKQKVAHPTHLESTTFTSDAVREYEAANPLRVLGIEHGTYKKNQGVPTGGICEEI